MRGPFRSITTRLLVPLLLVVGLGFGALAYSETRARRADWSEMMRGFAERTATLVEDATHHEMLLNRKDVVQLTLQKLAAGEGVEAARIYEPNGRVAFSSRVHEVVKKGAYRSPREPLDLPYSGSKDIESPEGVPGLALYRSIPNMPACSNATCHAHPPEKRVLGILEVQLSMAEFEQREREARRSRMALTAVIVLLVGGGVVFFVHRFVRQPVQELRAGTERVATGVLDGQIRVFRDDELGQLATAFNQMTVQLDRNRQELTAWSAELEARVAKKTEEIARVQRQQLETEKLASLGKLAAVVAHELNNPLGGILTYAKLVERKLGAKTTESEIGRYLSVIQSESVRCGDIVKNLLLFARRGGNRLGPVRLSDLAERAVRLVSHKLEISGATVSFHPLDGDDRMVGDEGELQQAILALLLNAADAVAPTRGRVTVSVHEAGGGLEVRIEDDGPGIPQDVRPHIFEPFFTTKGDAGSGIGLAVAFGIARRHGGTVEVRSELGVGSTFSFRVQREAAEGDASPEELVKG